MLPSHPPSPATNKIKLIGQILIEAGLLAEPQLELALADQKIHSYRNLRLGEILALRGWVSQQTSDFFASSWQNILRESTANNNPIKPEQCLYLAGLVTRNQLLEISQNSNRKLNNTIDLLLECGHVSQRTLDFFTNNLRAKKKTEKQLKELLRSRQVLSPQEYENQQRSLAQTLVLTY